jgi:hypothetical protein
MDFDTFNLKRDRELRKHLLRTLHRVQIAPLKGLHGSKLMQYVDDLMPPVKRFESEDHALLLMRELEAKGLATIEDERNGRSQMFSLDRLVVRVTAKGSSLVKMTAPADPDIDDERNMGP